MRGRTQFIKWSRGYKTRRAHCSYSVRFQTSKRLHLSDWSNKTSECQPRQSTAKSKWSYIQYFPAKSPLCFVCAYNIFQHRPRLLVMLNICIILLFIFHLYSMFIIFNIFIMIAFCYYHFYIILFSYRLHVIDFLVTNPFYHSRIWQRSTHKL